MKLNVVHLIQQVSLFFNIIFKHIDKHTLFWHKFEDSTVVKTILGNSHWFTKTHFQFLIIVVSAASQVQLQWIMTNLFFKINFCTHAAYTSAPDVLNWLDELS